MQRASTGMLSRSWIDSFSPSLPISRPRTCWQTLMSSSATNRKTRGCATHFWLEHMNCVQASRKALRQRPPDQT